MRAKEEQRELVITRLSAHLLETGLSQTSLRQLAAAAGVSDRMLLYYFADKEEVLAATMGRIAMGATGAIALAMPEAEKLKPAAFVARAAQLTTGPDMRQFMRLWIEVVAAAAKGEAPFVAIAAQIMAGFQHWVDVRLDAPAGADREALVAAIIAVVDGLALIDVCVGPDLVARAVGAVGMIGRNVDD